jgi:polyisoprenoid-binding protein YceI
MTVPAGRYEIGADRDRLVLKTFREGLAAQVGHDLTIDVTRWSGELIVAEDLASSTLDVRVDLRSLSVRSGSRGVMPLTDQDKREIQASAAKTIGVDARPEATFGEARVDPGSRTISGTLRLAGQSGPFQLQVSETGSGRYHATGSVLQSAFGIKPYRGFFGALKVRDAVDVEVDVDLPASAS